MIDFPGFIKLVDTLGGMEFDVDKPIYNPEGTVSLQPGKQQLSGEEALAVVRFRSEEMGDIARVKRQQRFLEAAIEKLKGSNVVDWMKGVRAMSDSLRTDMSIQEMGMLATSLQGEGSKVTTATVPGDFLDLYGVSYWKPDLKALETLVTSFK
jgi:anionic cell wall polymer biosynthesis LytR-Cps2A-Psr (LCP) family protein